MKKTTRVRLHREVASWARKLATSSAIVTGVEAVYRGHADWVKIVVSLFVSGLSFVFLSGIAFLIELKADRLGNTQPYRLNRRRDSG